MLIKAISLIITYVMGRVSRAHSSQSSFLLNVATLATLRRTLMVSAGVFSGLVIFLGGFFTILTDMILSTRSTIQLSFSQASWVGVSLIIISLLIELALFSRRNWEPIVVQETDFAEPAKVQPIADALAELIRDFTMERRTTREQRTEQKSTASAITSVSTTASPVYN